MIIPFPVVLAVLAVTFWPVTAAILLTCVVLAFKLQSVGARIACGVVGVIVVLTTLGGALLLGG